MSPDGQACDKASGCDKAPGGAGCFIRSLLESGAGSVGAEGIGRIIATLGSELQSVSQALLAGRLIK